MLHSLAFCVYGVYHDIDDHNSVWCRSTACGAVPDLAILCCHSSQGLAKKVIIQG